MEAAGVEPDPTYFTNSLMARDFPHNSIKTRCLVRNSLSPSVPPSPLESSPVLETLWRRTLWQTGIAKYGSSVRKPVNATSSHNER